MSLIGVCSLLLLLGYSINLLSLLAMVLAIGLVVDDAIVVVENIHRHIEEGLTPIDAAIQGMKEITGPVVAMTLTLAAVLAPLGFTGGLTGSLFREFAFTLAGAVVISGIVALTITPIDGGARPPATATPRASSASSTGASTGSPTGTSGGCRARSTTAR